ncbi:MAG TPA: hypothetical protein VH459_10900, partial [Gaiellales bacterium]
LLGTTRQNVKQLARALERKGFLVVAAADDARARRLVVTERHHAVWAGRSADDQRTVAEWFSALSDDEVQVLFDLLRKLQVGLRAPTESLS